MQYVGSILIAVGVGMFIGSAISFFGTFGMLYYRLRRRRRYLAEKAVKEEVH